MERRYIAIDLKSFYASVECVSRKLDPLTTNLVVADESRTEKTICLAVSPSLKAYGISGRARLFEVVQKMKEVNAQRLQKARRLGIPAFTSSSTDAPSLAKDPSLEAGYIAAPPRMHRKNRERFPVAAVIRSITWMTGSLVMNEEIVIRRESPAE